jgi:hypothetical protein
MPAHYTSSSSKKKKKKKTQKTYAGRENERGGWFTSKKLPLIV